MVIPTRRRPENLKMLLESLSDQTLDASRYEVIVVDDASSDATSDVLARTSGLTLRSEQLDQNSGPARARNRGIDLARNDVILFLDDDVVASRTLLATHLDFHNRHNDAWMGLLGRVDWHPTLRVTPFMRWVDRSGLQFPFDTWLKEGPVEQPHRAFLTANLSLHRETLLAVGSFDERFKPPYLAYEDFELGLRLERRGFRLEYRPEALAYHTRPLDLATFRRRMKMVAESSVLLRMIHPDFPLTESLLRGKRDQRRRAKILALAPIAWLLRNERVLGMAYRELLACAYAEGKRKGAENLRLTASITQG